MPEGLLIVISHRLAVEKGRYSRSCSLKMQISGYPYPLQRVSRGREKKMENSIILSVTKSFRI